MWMTIAVSDDLEQFIEANRGEASPEQYALLLVERGRAAVVEDVSHKAAVDRLVALAAAYSVDAWKLSDMSGLPWDRAKTLRDIIDTSLRDGDDAEWIEEIIVNAE